MFFALHCRVASPLCSRRLVVLAVACSVEDSSRCVAVPLSSVCPRRRVCCARRRCCSLASWPLLLRCCLALMLLCCVRRRFSVECSSRCFVSVDRLRPVLRPCVPVAPCPVPWPVVAGVWVWVWVPWSHSGRGVCPSPGVFFVGIKITPRPSSWKVDGVGVHFLLTTIIPPGVTVALPAEPTTSVLGRVGRCFAYRACLRA